jgi:hypothetical protein
MAFSQFGTESQARRKRVYYEGTDTIYEGMALCYNYDTTSNILGFDPEDEVVSSTTAEGYQNEGKFLRVEEPATANLAFFAGVVAGGSYAGLTGPRWIDIYIPNGAIVPVRSELSTTVGVTAFHIQNGEYELGATGRPVAIAMETVNRSDTNGICLAKLDPSMFVYLQGASAIAKSASGSASLIHTTHAHVTGYSVGLTVNTTSTGAIAATGGANSVTGYLLMSGSLTATTGYTRAILAQLNLTGTIDGSNQHLTGLMAQVHGSPTFTECSKVAGIMVDLSLGVTPTSGDYNGIMISNNGANQTEVDNAIEIYGNYGINRLFSFQSCDGITANFISNGGTGDTTLTTGDDWKKIKIKIGSTDYYLIAMNNPAES